VAKHAHPPSTRHFHLPEMQLDKNRGPTRWCPCAGRRACALLVLRPWAAEGGTGQCRVVGNGCRCAGAATVVAAV